MNHLPYLDARVYYSRISCLIDELVERLSERHLWLPLQGILPILKVDLAETKLCWVKMPLNSREAYVYNHNPFSRHEEAKRPSGIQRRDSLFTADKYLLIKFMREMGGRGGRRRNCWPRTTRLDRGRLKSKKCTAWLRRQPDRRLVGLFACLFLAGIALDTSYQLHKSIRAQ